MNGRRYAGDKDFLTMIAAKLRSRRFRRCYYGVPELKLPALRIACDRAQFSPGEIDGKSGVRALGEIVRREQGKAVATRAWN
jgi:hypothetical protein